MLVVFIIVTIALIIITTTTVNTTTTNQRTLPQHAITCHYIPLPQVAQTRASASPQSVRAFPSPPSSCNPNRNVSASFPQQTIVTPFQTSSNTVSPIHIQGV